MELFKDQVLWKCGFSLTAHEVVLKFIAESQEIAHKWYIKLKRMSEVVSTHISKDYTIGKLISRGNFTKINIATHNETGTQVTVKSVGKSILFDRPKSLVKNYIKKIEGNGK